MSLNIVRVSSRQGIKRMEVNAATTVGELAMKIEKELNVPMRDQRLSVRLLGQATGAGQGAASTLLLTQVNQKLVDIGLKNGDLVYLESPETSMSAAEIQQHMEAKMPQSPPAPIASPKQSEHHHHAVGSKDIVEDEIDTFLRKQDGWVPRKRSRYCKHPVNGSCSHCMPLAPWAIATAEEFESLNLKHIPYHAWLREKYYRSTNNPVILEDPIYRLEINKDASESGGPSASATDRMSVTLERQPYRHVDHVEFDNPAIVDRFIAGWRESGRQRIGYLYGRYVPDVTLPLGIRAMVSAVYEPPQQSTKEQSVLLKDADEERVDQLASRLGLKKIGIIWTALFVNENRQIVPDRDFENIHLKSQECMRMGRLQAKYPSPSKESTSTGTFGSKFVSVLVYGNKEGNIEISAWQISNQVTRLIRDGAVRDAKEPQYLRVRPSKDNVLYPDVFYRHKNEYGFFVNSKAEPDFPIEYALISLRHSFPKDPQPHFKSIEFPIENRPAYTTAPSGTAVISHLRDVHGASYMNRLNDFHLLMFLQKHVEKALFEKIMVGVLRPGDVIETQIRPMLDATFATSSRPTQPQPAQPKQQPAAPAQPAAADPAAARQAQMVQQLCAMGYAEQQAREALWATNYVSVESALDLLLGQM